MRAINNLTIQNEKVKVTKEINQFQPFLYLINPFVFSNQISITIIGTLK